ncbi:MAG: acyl-CoA thioesterase [Bacteroidales bacterium]|nr:acyl-CoA thioesterase [Bacteroidales bacterium]MCM1146885.1 acyl-CoA thioesterase [Bacteroidales bacterium]MCM1205617.1 acyl-CoA thioesterase [Bacillota bacterium]MCM1510272.1 acyl-CoA thioesterase [Clostridium sp.]
MKYHYETIMQVRDYECDIQGIVNNANYLHYTEHTRHLFLQHCGISFSEMHTKGEDFVVARMNLQYKSPLRPDDEFRSCIRLKKEGLRYIFFHDIYRLRTLADGARENDTLCFRSQVDVVCLINGRLAESEVCNKAFAKYLDE